MKQHNKVKRLKARQAEFDKAVAENPELAFSCHRPGSIKK